MAKSDTNNPILLLINWIFLGIVTVIQSFINLIKCELLGYLYFVHGLVYPFSLFFKKTGDKVFGIYENEAKKKNSLSSAIPEEKINLDSGDEDFKPKEEEAPVLPRKKESQLDIFYNNLWFVKQMKRKEEETRADLIASMNEEVRSDKPVTYRYTAVNPDGKKEINTFIAFSKMEVFAYLENENYRVLKIDTNKTIEFLYGPTSFTASKFNNKDLIFWITQLSTYLKSGIPLINSMRILSKQMSKDASKKRVFDSIIYNLTLGENFSSSLEKQGNTFPTLLINMVKAAEATGELEATLDDMSNYYTEVEATRKQMISAMSYPVIIMVFSLGVVTFIMLYVIPQFQSVYSEAGAELNAFTLSILVFSKFMQENIMSILLIAVLIILTIIILYQRVKAVRHALQTFMMKVPLIGKIIIFKEMNIFAKTFSSLLKNNVFITESIGLLTNITKNEIYRDIMIETIDNIAKGDKISDAFKDHWAVPDVAYYMIVTGESTGELADMMARVADYYQTSHKAIINSMKSFIEPIMIVFLAVVVGGIIMAVILPMFNLYTQIQ